MCENREKIVRLIFGAVVVVCCYYLGELTSYFTRGFISPAVAGMVILFILLKAGLIKRDWVEGCAMLFADNMILFFVPVMVGIVLIPLSVWVEDGIAMATALVLSTFMILWLTGIIVEKGGKGIKG